MLDLFPMAASVSPAIAQSAVVQMASSDGAPRLGIQDSLIESGIAELRRNDRCSGGQNGCRHEDHSGTAH